MSRQIIEIKSEKERLLVAPVVIANGYTVRQVAIIPKGSKTKIKVLEYWKEEK